MGDRRKFATSGSSGRRWFDASWTEVAKLRLSLVLLLAACGGGESAPAAAADVATYTVARRDLRVTITEKGTLKTANQILVRPKVPGQAKIVSLVDEGTQVQAGDVLCELDGTEVLREVQDLENRVIALRGEVTAASAELEIQLSENQSAVRDAELALGFADLEFKRWQEGELVQETSRRRFRVTECESEKERAEKRFAQMPGLAEEGFVTKEQVEEDELHTTDGTRHHYCRAIAIRIDASSSLISSPLTSITAV